MPFIKKIQCKCIPEMNILKAGSNPAKHLFDAAQVIGFLNGLNTRRDALHATNQFFESQGAKMRSGGDLLTAYQAGDMDALVYTHLLPVSSSPSYFLTTEGVIETLRCLPNQIEIVQAKLKELILAYPSSNTLNPDNDQEAIEATSSGDQGDVMTPVPRSTLCNVQLQSYIKQSQAELALERERTAMATAIGAKNLEMVKVISSKDLEMAKVIGSKDLEIEKANHAAEKAKWELERFQLQNSETKLKDSELEKAELKLQLKDAVHATEKATHAAEKAQWVLELLKATKTGDDSSQNHRRKSPETVEQHSIDSDEEEHEPVAKKTSKSKGRRVKHSFFQIQSTYWDNDFPDVNLYKARANDNDDVHAVDDLVSSTSKFQLSARLANGTIEPAKKDNKYHFMGMYYKGDCVSQKALVTSSKVKEAYGVEANGFQYLCIVLSKQNGRRINRIANFVYDNHILPRSIIPEPIPGQGSEDPHHVSVYQIRQPSDDPVLAMLKTPSPNKWKWINPDPDQTGNLTPTHPSPSSANRPKRCVLR